MLSINDIDYDTSCFVDMPYETKTLDGKEIDFEWIYSNIFQPAISSAGLLPFRSKDVYDPRPVHKRMFLHVFRSIMVTADITGDNPNVMLELGARIMTDKSGTVLVGQRREQWVYDISVFHVVRYQFSPEEMVAESIRRIGSAVAAALVLARQKEPLFGFRSEIAQHMNVLEEPLGDAYAAILECDWTGAAADIEKATRILPDNALLRQLQGVTLRADGRLADSRRAFQQAVENAPDYADAVRELGVTAAREFSLSGRVDSKVLALDALQRAADMGGDDVRTMTYLGGILESENRLPEALASYRQALGQWSDNTELHTRVRDLQARLQAPVTVPATPLLLEPAWKDRALQWNFRLLDLDPGVSRGEITRLLSDYGEVSDVAIKTSASDAAEGSGKLVFSQPGRLADLTSALQNANLHGRQLKITTPAAGGGVFSSGLGGSLY